MFEFKSQIPYSVLERMTLLLGSFPSASWREERSPEFGFLVKISLNPTDH